MSISVGYKREKKQLSKTKDGDKREVKQMIIVKTYRGHIRNWEELCERLGILSGGWNLLWILFAAFLIASVYGGIMIARKKYTRKNSFPFIPFLTVAYLGGMIGGVY